MFLLLFCFLANSAKAFTVVFRPLPVVADQAVSVDFWIVYGCGSSAEMRPYASVSVDGNVITLKMIG